MKAKMILIIVCALVLAALGAVSCRKKTTEQPALFRSVSARSALTSSVKVSLGGYSFDAFLNRGLIRVSDNGDDAVRYGVLNASGDVVLPVSFVSVISSGGFLVAEGGEVTPCHYVYSATGKLLGTFQNLVEVKDVGGGCFAVYDKETSGVYNEDGVDLLPATLLDASFSYSVCGDYILARSDNRGHTFVFHARTSDLLLSFYDSSTAKNSVVYLGGKNFLHFRNDLLEGAAAGAVCLTRDGENKYYKQTVRRYTIGAADPVLLTPGRFLAKIVNRYSIGVTTEEREEYSLTEGYHAVYYYSTDESGKAGGLFQYIADGSLNEVKALPAGVSSFLTPVNGVAAVASPAGKILFFDEKANVIRTIDDAVYQNVVFSGEIATAGKVTAEGVVRLGGFDKTGKVVLPFDYSYISAFVGGKAVATKGGKTYLVTTGGGETYIGDYSFPHYFDGFYPTTSGEYVGATSYDGVLLISPVYQSITDVRRYKESVLVAASIGPVVDVYRLY